MKDQGGRFYLTNYCKFQSKDFRNLVRISLPASRTLRASSLTRLKGLTLTIFVVASLFQRPVTGIRKERHESDSNCWNLLPVNRVSMNRSNIGTAKNRTLTLKEQNSTVPKDYEIRTTELIHQAAILKNEWNEASLRKAIESLSEALPRLKTVNNRSDEPAVLHEIGEIYLILSDYRAALRSHMEELSVSMKPSEKAHSLNALAEVHIYLGEYQKARSYSQQALKLSRRRKDTEAQANSLVNIGEIHYFQGNSQRALSFLGEALMVPHDQP